MGTKATVACVLHRLKPGKGVRATQKQHLFTKERCAEVRYLAPEPVGVRATILLRIDWLSGLIGALLW